MFSFYGYLCCKHFLMRQYGNPAFGVSFSTGLTNLVDLFTFFKNFIDNTFICAKILNWKKILIFENLTHKV